MSSQGPTAYFTTTDRPAFCFTHEGIGQANPQLTIPFFSTVALWVASQAVPYGTALPSSRSAIKVWGRRADLNLHVPVDLIVSAGRN